MIIQRKRVAKRLASGLMAGALALGGLAISGGTASAETPASPSTNRIYGASRYETAVALARNAGNTPTSGLVIASGESYADALAAASLTTANRPLLLVGSDSIPEIVLDYISDNVVAMSNATPTIYVVGGESAVSAEVFDTIKSAVILPTDTTPPTVTRVSGADRYATALEIGKLTTGNTDTVIIVSGNSWADALSASNISAENGWPIVLSGTSGLDASGKALIDYYEALPGVTPSYLIIGGPAAVPNSVESHLISTNLNAPASIRRIAGADRYQTNLFTNVYLYGGGGGGNFDGDTVALVSGEAPWDGIAASHWAAVKDSHIALTKSGSLDASTAALSDTLAGLAAIADAAGDNGTLYVIGGKSAVADAVKTAYIATSTAVNTTSTMTGCNDGSKHLTITLGAAVSTNEATALTTDNAGIEAALLLNNAAVNAGATVTNSTGDNQTFEVTLNSALTSLDVLKFLGVTETGTLATRSIAGSSCTVVDDVVRPSVTIRAIPGLIASSGGEGGPKIIVSSSEPIKFSSGATVTAGGVTFGSVNNDTAVTVTALGTAKDTDYYTDFILITDTGEGTLADLTATTAVALQAANIVDRGGNSPLAVATKAANDVTAPVITVVPDCSTDTNQATRSLGAGALTVSAAANGKWDGAIGNSFTVAVVNSRGLEMPTIAVDTTAKTIVITVDTGYHTGSDVDAVAKSMFLEDALLGDWAFGGTGALTTAATTTPLPLADGQSTCTLLLLGNEPFQINTDVAATVNGLGSGYVGALTAVGGSLTTHDSTDVDTGKAMSRMVTHTTKVVGSAYLSVTTTGDDSINDVNGNSVATAITYTVS